MQIILQKKKKKRIKKPTQCEDMLAKSIIGHFSHSKSLNPVSILRKSISGRHRPVRVADGPMTDRCRFT